MIVKPEQCGLVKVAVVVHPAPDAGIELPGQLVQADRGLSRKVPLANRLPDALHCRCTDRGQEARPYLPVAFPGASWPEFKLQKRKTYSGIVLPAKAVLAVHDAGFIQMHFQFALLQPLLDASQRLLRLSFASAMRNGIISVTGKWIIRVFPLH